LLPPPFNTRFSSPALVSRSISAPPFSRDFGPGYCRLFNLIIRPSGLRLAALRLSKGFSSRGHLDILLRPLPFFSLHSKTLPDTLMRTHWLGGFFFLNLDASPRVHFFHIRPPASFPTPFVFANSPWRRRLYLILIPGMLPLQIRAPLSGCNALWSCEPPPGFIA